MQFARKCILIFVLIIFSNLSFAQIKEHLKWDIKLEQLTSKKFEVIASATLDNDWHIYSTKMDDGGPQKTIFKIDNNSSFKVSEETVELGHIEEKYDSSFHIILKYFPGKVLFKKILDLSDTTSFKVNGVITYMICTDQECLPPQKKQFTLNYNNTLNKSTKVDSISKIEKNVIPKVDSSSPKSNRSFLYIFIAGFLAGLAALLTPCVFPMIPMTVSFFTKKSKNRVEGIKNAIIYAISIVVIYVALGFGVSKIFGIDALNALSTNFWFNLFFFILLIIFAASFFGAFEISLPTSFVNKVDEKSGKGGFVGIFFMAFTLSLVSFSCTGPIVGTLLFEAAATGNVGGPIWGMVGFSSALALPFGLFAAFPGWLNSLPKSGGWLNSIKVSLGFLELALALKFLSNADLVVQAKILTREIFLVIWIIIFILWGIYLMGKIKFAHDSEVKHITVTRLGLIIIVFSFALYLIPGLWGAPLKLISGFPPPEFYSEWKHEIVSSNNTSNSLTATTEADCPNGLNCFHDYEEGLAFAKKVNKPILLDFTGWACVNCRKMENLVWTDPDIDAILRNKVVLISLYVDDKRALPDSEISTKSLGDTKYEISTIGNKWSYFQASKFNINSQPYYVLLDTNNTTLSRFEGYSSDIKKFKEFLDSGISKFH